MSDMISRQTAIDSLQNCRKHCIDPMDSYHIDIQDAEYQLSKVPSAEPETCAYWDRESNICALHRPSAQPGWIPCNDLMPEHPVLCCDNRGDYLIAIPFVDESSSTGYSAENDECYMYDCIAWMPLPEPYKERRQ